ncbi:MAG: DUF2079 domain-containing protein [Chloroflexia bacterium]
MMAASRRAFWEISPRQGQWLVFGLAAVYFVVFSIMSSLKYQWFGQGHDLVLHEQAIWNTTQGRIFQVTGFVRPSSLFGYDPYLIELLVVPLYALIPTVFTLFVLQSLVIAAGAPAVWLIARDEGLPPVAGLAAVVLYFAHPTVQYTNLDAFRERSFGLCFFLWAMWAFRRDRWRVFLVFLVLLIICRLEAALFASCFGIYALLKGKPRRYVIVPLVLGLGYFFIGNFVFVPLVNAGQPVSYVYEYFAPLGTTMGEVIRTTITHPIYTIETTFRTAKIVYLVLLFLPTAGLALLAPKELVFMVPLLGINFLATKPELTNIRYWYSMLLIGPLAWWRRLWGCGECGTGWRAMGDRDWHRCRWWRCSAAWRWRALPAQPGAVALAPPRARAAVGDADGSRLWTWCRMACAALSTRAAGSRRICCAGISTTATGRSDDPADGDVIIADVSSNSFDEPEERRAVAAGAHQPRMGEGARPRRLSGVHHRGCRWTEVGTGDLRVAAKSCADWGAPLLPGLIWWPAIAGPPRMASSPPGA